MVDESTETRVLLAVQNLTVSLGQPPQEVVSDVTFIINRGEILGMAGESGSGKSMTSLALTQLLPHGARPRWSGQVHMEGCPDNLLRLPSRTLRRIRGRRIGYIFQEPSSSFNPVFTIGHQLKEVLKLRGTPVSQRREAAQEAMEAVGIRASEENLAAYPGSFSGGMLQRMAIACALAGEPDLLVADEPTTALDTTTQKRITDLLLRLNRERGMAILFISHNLGLLRQVAGRLMIMRSGKIVESGLMGEVLDDPKHPYTRDLLQAVPKLKRPKA